MNILVGKRLGMLKTSAVAAACLTLMSFLVACGGGAGSANTSSWEKAITPPKLTGLSPPVGPTTGGTPVAITGTDIQKGATVVFGNVPAAKINSVTSTSIEAVTPVHDPANVDVKVTNPDAGSDTLLGAFTFEGSPPPIGGPAPTISSVLPNSGPVIGGTVVTITGTDFQSGATVTFEQTPAAVVFSSATQLQATTPPHAEGPVDVIVRNPDTQSATVSGGFTYQPVPPPTITSVSPASGTIAGGTSVTITGTGFQPGVPGTTVTFGGVAGTGVNVLSATQIQAVTPAHATGAVDVRVANPDTQSAMVSGGFTYQPVLAPTIITILPTSGPASGGTTVTINGSNFVSGAVAFFGTILATSTTFVSPTQLQAVTPAGSGRVDVTVRNPDQQAGTLFAAFVFISGGVTVYYTDDFDSSNHQAFYCDDPACTPTVVTQPDDGYNAHGGTKMVKGALTAGQVALNYHWATSGYTFGNAGAPYYSTAPKNAPLVNANGLYFRWWVLVTPATLASCTTTNPPHGQIKFVLARWNNRYGTSDQPGFVILTFGNENGQNHTHFAWITDSLYESPGGYGDTGFQVPSDTWFEVQLWMKSTSNAVVNQQFGTGDGVTKTFNFAPTMHDGVATNSVTITGTVGGATITGTDNGSGAISGAGITGSFATRGYDQGKGSVTFTNPPDYGTAVSATYNYTQGRVIGWIDGVQRFNTGWRGDIGSADPAAQLRSSIGVGYTQGCAGGITIYTDDVSAADGYIQP